jgi:hypothetical protein
MSAELSHELIVPEHLHVIETVTYKLSVTTRTLHFLMCKGLSTLAVSLSVGRHLLACV